MPKFFVPTQNIKNDSIIITGGDVLHIKKVLRFKTGDTLSLCDSAGFDYDTVINEFNENSIICTIKSKTKSDTEPNIKITLFQGIPKSSKMDYIIQKTTELGISRIVPCIMERCVVKINDAASAKKKLERWRKVAEEAAKQSGRGVIPEICEPMIFSDAMMEMKKYDLYFAPYEGECEMRLKPVLLSVKSPKSAGFIIGPEGGFDIAEIEKIRTANIPIVTLGKRILRTETAGEAVLSMIMYEIGDINL